MSSLHLRGPLAAALVGTVLLTFTACSDDSSTTATSSSSSPAPEDVIAPAAEVAAGLRRLGEVSDQIVAAGTDKDTAKPAIAQLEPIWEHIEGAVRKNDLDVYVSVEEDLVLLAKAGNGDADTAKRGGDDLRTQIDTYLASHPG